MEKRIAIFPGSFDPFTIGHYSIVERALPLFDKIIIAIGINQTKKSFMTEAERVESIKAIYKGNDKVEVLAYNNLTTDLANEHNAKFIVRGVRLIQDFEYEKNLAEVNRDLTGIETILLYTLPEYGHISSSIVRELVSYGKDVTSLLPPGMKLPQK